jgi:hypothetical protein
MGTDPAQCREQAKRCLKLAADTSDPVLKTSLTETAQRWERLAADLESDTYQTPRSEQFRKRAG